MQIVIDYFLNAFNLSINLFYFFTLMFVGELVKMIPIVKYNADVKQHFLLLKEKIIYFNFKHIILLLGILIGSLFFMVDGYGQPFNVAGMSILRLVLTFSITLTMYDLFFQLIIIKFKQFLNSLIKKTINTDLLTNEEIEKNEAI